MSGDRASAGSDKARGSFDSSSDAAAQLERLRQALADRYVIERELGHGGTANVYRAIDLRRKTSVALKVLRPELSAAFGTARFDREIEIGQRLDHPNILRIIESGAAGGDLYYTMPLIDGSTLRARLRQERQLPVDEAISIVRQVAAGLEYAHAHGFIHRDITPGNILLDGTKVLVADLGIARAMTVLSGERITGSGISLGTPEYMSPEQATGEQWIDGRTDLYSLGCVLYEMLAGEPPFTGPSAQAIVARHCQDTPRSLRIARPAIPPGLERFIMKALSKVPADRFSSASAMIAALDAIDVNERAQATWTWSRWRAGVAALAVIGAALGAWAITRPPQLVLDLTRVIVFPLRDALANATDAPANSGEGVATFIGNSLEGARPLQWRAGIELMKHDGLKASQLTDAVAETLSMKAGAGYFIGGTIIRRPDSTTLTLTLHDVRADSVIATAIERGGPSAFLPGLGERAVKNLLPPILAPGRTVDLRPLSKIPAAIANFLQGDREYRGMQFRVALEHFRAAVREDSAFAIAAFRGAQTQTWLSDTDTTLVDVALRRPHLLSPSQVMLAHGLRAYMTGDADSAVTYLRSAVAADSTVAGAWGLLGEVYARTLAEQASDSLAIASLRRARELDRDFAPALELLEELAVQAHDVPELSRLRDDLRRAGADTTHAMTRGLISQCVQDGAGKVKWIDAARRDIASTLNAGRELSRRMSFPACADAAFTAVMQADSTKDRSWAKGALFGLQGLRVASKRTAEIPSLFSSKGAAKLPVGQLYLAGFAIGAGFEREADVAADSILRHIEREGAQGLWLIGGWAARKKEWGQLRDVARRARERAKTSRSRPDLLVASLLEARVPLASGDTDEAINRLRALRPNGPRSRFAWVHFEGLGAERLLLAELYLAKRRYRASIDAASLLDATEPVPYLLYLRQSLELRFKAATALGDRQLADQYERRLRALEQP